jgi:hypothetical protein
VGGKEAPVGGKRIEPEEFAVDDVVVTYAAESRCRNRCKGQRSNLDSPAVLVTIFSEGVPKKVLICDCCEQPLTFDPVGGAPAIDPTMIEGKHKRFFCADCRYNVVLLSELKPV